MDSELICFISPASLSYSHYRHSLCFSGSPTHLHWAPIALHSTSHALKLHLQPPPSHQQCLLL
jgi:hypothetical protein